MYVTTTDYWMQLLRFEKAYKICFDYVLNSKGLELNSKDWKAKKTRNARIAKSLMYFRWKIGFKSRNVSNA